MKLILENIGNIGKAVIEINGITVIAGENNTGKSTISRALFSVFNGFCQIEKKIRLERINGIRRLLVLLFQNQLLNIRVHDILEIANRIITHIDLYRNNIEKMKHDIIQAFLEIDKNIKDYADSSQIDTVISRINAALCITDLNIMKSILEKTLNAEFNGQFSNIFTNETGAITLQIHDKEIKILVENNHVLDIKNDINLYTEAIYLDDPLVLDEIQTLCLDFEDIEEMDHSAHLREKICSSHDINLVEEIVINNKLSDIYNKLETVFSGEIIRDKRFGFRYQKTGTEEYLDLRNLSTGLKTFSILKLLLTNGSLDYNGTIILDEPEIHLHPEWQLLFAELIVLIHKEFGMHILLNTHSPYFLNAIEVYTMKHGVDDKCKYYLASASKDISGIEDVTNHVEAIYSKLARPLQVLENERWKND
ncbi:MAG: ATP-binding protein [Lachnospiraceae bacterium]|jgi:ABC-type multidrug transport system ATPase subunit|nr:ATP-binding protein [Lachnospiraceae bacterium]